MTQHFEGYSLLYEVGDDALGKVYCAARRDSEPAKFVLLRLFDRGSIDILRFRTAIGGRWALARTFVSPHLAGAIESGVSGDQPFCALPYVAGKSLRTWLDRAKARHLLFPLDAALRIVGDVACGLRAASGRSLGDLALLHGFVVPQLVLVTARGDARLCHLDAAPALRNLRVSAHRLQRILPYLSPEAREGGELYASDDVYSLGSLLFEMLTLKPVPLHASSPCEPLGPVGARSDLRYFLGRCLAPRFRRFQSVAEWQRAFDELVATHDLSASPEDVSLFFGALDVAYRTSRPQPYDTATLTARELEVVRKPAPAQAGEPQDVLRRELRQLRQLAHLG